MFVATVCFCCNALFLIIMRYFRKARCGCGRAVELGNFQCWGVLLNWIIVRQSLICLQ